MTTPGDAEILLYIGTYTASEDDGIHVYRMDGRSGELTFSSKMPGVENPSFLALHPDGSHLYAVNEVSETALGPGGGVSAFSIDADTGELTFLNQRSTQGAGPCHLSVDAEGKFVLAANYLAGSLAVLPIRSAGSLGEATDVVQHKGSSVNVTRQQGPHAHSITPDPAGRHFFAPDLGIDRVMVYRLDTGQGRLVPHDVPWVQARPGAGPRHMTFSPDGRFAYLINEIDTTITAFAYDAARGTLTEVTTVSAIPDGYEGRISGADVHVAPSGRFLYGSIRHQNSIVAFEIDQGSGDLRYVGHESSRGSVPRNFAIDPTGTFLLVANQGSDTVVTFRIDQDTGKLTPTGEDVHVPRPVCLRFLPES
jgi:6-phosphogluconolactonase